MLIIYTGDTGYDAEEVANGSITAGELRRVLNEMDDNDHVIINVDGVFADIDSCFDEY